MSARCLPNGTLPCFTLPRVTRTQPLLRPPDMLKIAVVTRYFPSSAEPWQGRSAYQTLRLIARHATVQAFYPNASYPSFLKPRSRIYDALDRAYSPADVKTTYHDYPALPL